VSPALALSEGGVKLLSGGRAAGLGQLEAGLDRLVRSREDHTMLHTTAPRHGTDHLLLYAYE
jgi:hypothetical protein